MGGYVKVTLDVAGGVVGVPVDGSASQCSNSTIAGPTAVNTTETATGSRIPGTAAVNTPYIETRTAASWRRRLAVNIQVGSGPWAATAAVANGIDASTDGTSEGSAVNVDRNEATSAGSGTITLRDRSSATR